jgi:hypothetical protein
MIGVAPGSKYHIWSLEKPSWHLSSHLSPYLAGAWDNFLKCCHLVLLYLDATLPFVGRDVMGAMLLPTPTYER